MSEQHRTRGTPLRFIVGYCVAAVVATVAVAYAAGGSGVAAFAGIAAVIGGAIAVPLGVWLYRQVAGNGHH